jgi:hypothetical protein
MPAIGQSETIVQVLDMLMEKLDFALMNRVDVPIVVLKNRLDNRRHHDCYKCLLLKPQRNKNLVS